MAAAAVAKAKRCGVGERTEKGQVDDDDDEQPTVRRKKKEKKKKKKKKKILLKKEKKSFQKVFGWDFLKRTLSVLRKV